MNKETWPQPEQVDEDPAPAFGPNAIRNAWFGSCSSARFGAAARLIKDKSGVAAIEYGLLCALIALAVVTGITEVGSGVNQGFTEIEEEVAIATGNEKGNGKGKGKGKGKKDR